MEKDTTAEIDSLGMCLIKASEPNTARRPLLKWL